VQVLQLQLVAAVAAGIMPEVAQEDLVEAQTIGVYRHLVGLELQDKDLQVQEMPVLPIRVVVVVVLEAQHQ
jgi:hypothetical protein